MKMGPSSPMPWDMVVIATITLATFGFSVQRIMHPERNALSVSMTDGKGAAGASSPNVPSQTLDVGCLEEKPDRDRVNSQDGAIRLKGVLCHLDRRKMRGFDGMTVKNLTTGYEGTIFFKGYGNAFVTDYLALASGRNLIQIEWRESPTIRPRTYTAEVFEK